MSKRTRLTDDERQAIADDIRNGHPRNEIARRHNRSQGTVSAIARDIGCVFDRAETECATRARQRDNRARRAELATGMLEDALRLRAGLFAEVECVAVSKDGDVVRYRLAKPTPADQRNLAVAVKVLADGATSLEQVDSNEGDFSAVGQWLAAMGAGETVVAA